MSRALTILALAVLACGCQKPGEPVSLDAAGVSPAADYRDLAEVLKKAVNPNNHLVPDVADECTPALDRQLRLLEVTGPTVTPHLFPTADDRIAYWYNASAAWSIKLAWLEKCPQEMTHEQLHGRSFRADGRWMTLDGIQAMLEKEGDFRVGLLVPCSCRQDAQLPRTIFTPADVRQRIVERFNDYLIDPARVKIDIEGKRIVYSPDLWRMRGRIIADYQRKYGGRDLTLATALLPCTSGRAQRRLQDAIGYRETAQREGGLLALPGKFEFWNP